ncbi:MAG: selenocysteine-specific translation elongation factor [Armatimonadia bacterium]
MPDELQQIIIGTAGHIDHGKTALVKALTGVDADTLEEEKRRGITIELGFVFMPQAAGDDRQIVFIDVPGHERLVKTMVAGASNLDAVMLIVAADEGVAAQTREHFDILKLLGMTRGLVALTKVDLVDEARREQVTNEVRGYLSGSFLADAPITPVSAVTGEGVQELRTALQALAATVEPRTDSGVFRMPVDRVFTMHGFGTVIAGTVLAGSVRVGDQVEILPEGLRTRVRGIQVHGAKTEVSGLGARTALNVPDVKKEDLRRGQTAAAPDSLKPTQRLDAQLYLLQTADELKHRARLRLHIGTDEVIARVALLDRERLLPGETTTVQFILEASTVAVPRDRFVVRTFSPLQTIGGGTILDAHPEKHKRFDEDALEGLTQLEGDLGQVIAQQALKAGAVPQKLADFVAATGAGEPEVAAAVAQLVEAGRLAAVREDYLHAEVLEDLASKLHHAFAVYYQRSPQKLWMPLSDLQAQAAKLMPKPVWEALFRQMVTEGTLVRKEQRVRPADRQVELKPQEQEWAERVARAYQAAAFSTPSEEEVRAELKIPEAAFAGVMTALTEQETLIRVSDKVIYHVEPLNQLREKVAALIRERGSMTVAELRDELGISRKYALAVMEYFDAVGLTRREGDARVLA